MTDIDEDIAYAERLSAATFEKSPAFGTMDLGQLLLIAATQLKLIAHQTRLLNIIEQTRAKLDGS